MKEKKDIVPNETATTGGIPKVCWFIVLMLLGGLFVVELFVPIAIGKMEDEQNLELPNSWKAYATGQWQEQQEQVLLSKHTTQSLVKVKNELDYQVFHQINVDGFVYGQEGYVFSEPTIASLMGDDFIGDNRVREYVRKARVVQDSLKKYGIDLIIMYAPGKASTLEDLLPTSVKKFKRRRTNYEAYAEYGAQVGLHVLDFNAYFKTLRDELPYQTFGLTGSHWSYYTECLVVDSTIRYIEQLTGNNLPNFQMSKIELRKTAAFRDNDIQKKGPRLSDNEPEQLAYPMLTRYTNDFTTQPIRVLGIGDSYYRCFAYLRAISSAFDNAGYWYYFSSQVNGQRKEPAVCDLDLRQALLRNRVIILQTNEANMENFGNGFIDEAYQMFTDPNGYAQFITRKRRLVVAKARLQQDPVQLKKMTWESQKTGISLDSLLARRVRE